jgi:hypothetical protein
MRQPGRTPQPARRRRPRRARLTPAEKEARIAEIGRQAVALALDGAILGRNREAARALGREAHGVAGPDGMARVFDQVVEAWGAGRIRAADDQEQFHPSSLSHAWRGIGEWEP